MNATSIYPGRVLAAVNWLQQYGVLDECPLVDFGVVARTLNAAASFDGAF